MSEEANAGDVTDPIALWKSWNEATTKGRSRRLDSKGEVYSSLFELYCWWMKSGVLFKLWYNATYGIWVQLAGAVMCCGWQTLSGAEIAQAAKHIDALEKRVCMLEDTFINMAVDNGAMAAGQPLVGGMPAPRHSPQGAWPAVDTAPAVLLPGLVVGELAERLERVESKLDRLLNVLAQSEVRVNVEVAGPDKGGEGGTLEEA